MQGSRWHRWLAAAVALMGLTAVAAAQADVAVGQPAPDFRLQDQNGKWHTLADHRGQWIVLYFYPKDQTPGCTKEACSFRDNIFAFEALGAVVLGVSLDDVASHDEFARKYSLPFPLLADSNGTVTNLYGVMGGFGPIKLAKRQSFLIAPDGKIARHYESVEPEKHSAEVLADLKALGAKKSS
ncbi:cytosolic tryparedoxin peroxidase, trypanosomatid typical 2-Cys peroxiredoxin [Gammaproteobacteria bacterium]|nr:peroxiredoxin [Gammaproteobacteria bacterium]QOJ30776.1 MAG: peroxiredoxin [Gammaproteobacteria bacterium]CAG0940781.1 cytosolic tryparedoxin peroxidase, trypanosomatid typical 2-Cys peroxiredoxin [Gammaproteobacteria bacterium]